MARFGPIPTFRALVALIAVATAVGIGILWPGDVDADLGETVAVKSESAEVLKVEEVPCQGFDTDSCKTVTFRLDTGPDAGKRATFSQGLGQGLEPDVDVGDRVRVAENVTAPGAAPVAGQQYTLNDFERRRPMLLLALIFAVVVVLFGRLRGALSLVGLAVSLVVVLVFMVPAIQAGTSPLAVAVLGALAIMLATILLAHGSGPKSLAAIVGTTGSLVLTVTLAVLFTQLTHLTGLSSEEGAYLQVSGELSLEGLLLAGMVVGALGVLDDVTISQASTVLALRAANPAQGFKELFGRAMDVGRDHVSATVNTLVLAYVGASLPVLLIFQSSTLGFGEAINLELIAKEIVATLVGSIGLIAAVPITTALAAVMARRIPASELNAEEHLGHAH